MIQPWTFLADVSLQNSARAKASREQTYRLAVLASHPVQYHVPFYRALANHPSIQLTVWYCSRLGLSGQTDPEFGIPLRWNIPLLEGYPSRFLRNYSPLAKPGRFFSLINPGIVSALFKNRYDAILIPGYAYASYLLGFFSSWLTGTPALLRGETVLKHAPRWHPKTLLRALVIGSVLRHARAFLAIGTPSRKFYRAHYIPEERVFFSPYSVDNEFFRRESARWRARRNELRRSLRMDPCLPVILFCGKLIPRKRPADLLGAFERLRRPATLLFVGEGSLRPQLERRAAGRSDVVFAGFVNQREVPRYYALADVFVLPSDKEVAPLVVHEAMACGLPVILSDAIPSCVDFVRPGENGFLFPMGDQSALSACLERILGEEALRSQMGERSFRLIQAWSPEAGAEGVVQALRHIRRGRS